MTAYRIMLSSAATTKAVSPVNMKSLTASKVLIATSGKHLSKSSIKTTSFFILAFSSSFLKFFWNSVNSVLLDVSSVILESFRYPPIASIAFVIPSSVDTVFFSISCTEERIAIGAVPVAIPNAVFPAVLATVIQLIFFQSFSKTPFALS